MYLLLIVPPLLRLSCLSHERGSVAVTLAVLSICRGNLLLGITDQVNTDLATAPDRIHVIPMVSLLAMYMEIDVKAHV